MPYSILLHPQAREAVGVDVRGNIVVIDEAHNLIEAINDLHAVQLTVAQVLRSNLITNPHVALNHCS